MQNIAYVGFFLVLSIVRVDCGNGELVHPEFTEPIKNITIDDGTNVELSCNVKHLGSYRVMWLKKDGHKETFVAINLLKITKNPRVTISLLQTSDDITQSTMYIRNTEKDDTAVYECAVNTNPMISQTGTLEVTVSFSSDKAGPIKPDAHFEDTSFDVSKTSQSDPEVHTIVNDNVTSADYGNGTIEFSDANQTDSNTNNTMCSEMKPFWEEATDSIKEFVKNVLDSLVNFTCSFLNLTPSN